MLHPAGQTPVEAVAAKAHGRESCPQQSASPIGLLWATFKRVTLLRGGQIEVSPTDSAEEAQKYIENKP
jgi:hypothetical protein